MNSDPDIQYTPQSAIAWRIECELIAYLRDNVPLVNPIVSLDMIGAKVYPRIFPDIDGVQFPAILVGQENMVERRGQPDSENVAWSLPYRLTLADTVSPRMHQRKQVYFLWRQALIDAFDQNSDGTLALKTAIRGITRVEMEPGVILQAVNNERFQGIISVLDLWVGTKRKRPDFKPAPMG